MNPKKARNFLKDKDPVLGKFIENSDKLDFPEKQENHFFVLSKSIVYQQLAGSAANAIFKRLIGLCDQDITSQKILKLTQEDLRNVGLSERKANYLKDLAHHFKTGSITSEKLKNYDNEKVIETLTKVKGIGPWTAEMFLMFGLGRPDVFSAKDLGLHKAISQIYKKDFPLKENELRKIALKWKPYRTLACLYLWNIKDNGNAW